MTGAGAIDEFDWALAELRRSTAIRAGSNFAAYGPHAGRRAEDDQWDMATENKGHAPRVFCMAVGLGWMASPHLAPARCLFDESRPGSSNRAGEGTADPMGKFHPPFPSIPPPPPNNLHRNIRPTQLPLADS